jgi:hypothetical protein
VSVSALYQWATVWYVSMVHPEESVVGGGDIPYPDNPKTTTEKMP